MQTIGRFFKRLGMLLRRERFNSELDEEMSFHREQKEKELLEAGVAPKAAHQMRDARVRQHDPVEGAEP